MEAGEFRIILNNGFALAGYEKPEAGQKNGCYIFENIFAEQNLNYKRDR